MVTREFNFRKPVNKIDTIEFPERKYQAVAFSSDIRTFLYYCSDRTSSLAKLLNLTNTSLFARGLFFLDYDRIFIDPFKRAQRQIFELKPKERFERLTSLYPLPSSSIILPLCGVSLDQVIKTIEKYDERAKESVQPYLEVSTMAFDVFNDVFESATQYYIRVIAEKVASDPEYVRKMRLRRKEAEFEGITSEVAKRVTPKFKKKLEDVSKRYRAKLQDLPSTWFTRIIEHHERLQLWKIYHQSFRELAKVCFRSDTIDLASIVELLQKMKSAQVLQDIRVEGICLNPKKNCNNLIIKYGVSNISPKCQECGDECFSWLAIAPIEGMVLHCWKAHYLPEMIVAALLSTADWVDEIFVHEKIRQLKPRTTKNFEIDVIVTTKDQELLLVEVSCQHSLDHVVPEFQRKCKNLAEFDYDGLFYLAPVEIDESFPVDEKAYILGLKHLEDPAESIHAILKKKIRKSQKK